MKNIIKQLAQEQKELKKQRKTGRYEFIPNPRWKHYWDFDKAPERVKKSWVAASKVQDNKLRITAALNLYHEKRGSPYRHNVAKHEEWRYGKLVVEINNEVSTLEKAQ